ncbi:DeoR/GlpR family DNA-binding transcription regulator [Leisingera sp. M527]|uniref:DeoR/GlpR family DNA-binding transcription regulator n=1 Tax=Leisingera sp. M527 TaxID=2867014 RepID=UPI0021A4505D|nr:DeoR/GlpR family DNA-binding transcription regulator [Leisingera sp. M527]
MSDSLSLSHRELELVDALRRLGGSARSAELAKMLDVSEETVRRTIKALNKAGAVQRVHGGAFLAGPQSATSFARRISENQKEKARIAARIAVHARDGMALFLDVGSTTAFVAEELRQKTGLIVVTNSIGAAQALANHNGNRVHFLGGELQSNERGTFGFVAEQQVRRFALDLAILSADAFSAKQGVLYHSAAEAQLAGVVADCTEQVALAMAHPKFTETAPHCGPSPRKISLLFTDRRPDKKLSAALAGWGVKVDVAPGGKDD